MYHKIIIVGNLGGDPQMRYLPDGKPVTSFSVAANRKWAQGEEVCWFRVTAFGTLAESCNEFLRKGRTVLVEATLSPDKNGGPKVWTGKDGEARASYDVVASNVRFLGGVKGDAEPADGGTAESEIPF